MSQTNFDELKESIKKLGDSFNELSSYQKNLKSEDEEKDMIGKHVKSLIGLIKKENNNVLKNLEKVNSPKKLNFEKPVPKENNEKIPKDNSKLNYEMKFIKNRVKAPASDEKETEIKLEKSASSYVGLANRLFSKTSLSLLNQGWFSSIGRDLEKANMDFLTKSYVSVIFLTTIISVFVGIFVTAFFMFFNIVSTSPFITPVTENPSVRFLKVFWILFAIPISTFAFSYLYPSLEKKSLGSKIDQELPFATINMAAISGSLINPTRIFGIIMSTKEYPSLEKEFAKIINGINVLGQDLVTSLRDNAFSSPSKKLNELFNGLATTISSGGDLPKFFDERAKSLLFEYKLDREKSIRAAETFMDIYISVVIAAPMILMLLLIIIQISGIGISLSTSAITLLIILAVVIINIMFLTFLHVRQSKEQ